MIRNLDDLNAFLSATPLSGRAWRELSISGSAERAFVLAVGAGGEDPLDAWKVLRDRVEDTGRWPVLAVSWMNGPEEWSGEDFFHRFPFESEPGVASPADATPEAVIEQSRTADPDAALEANASRTLSWRSFLEVLDEDLEGLEERIGRTPDREEVLALRSDGTLAELGAYQRWILAWEAEHAPEPETIGDRYLDWYLSQEPGPVALLLPPTSRSEEVLAYQSFYGCEGFGHANGVALLRRWHQRWGAELVGHHGTMLDLVVRRPPEKLSEAVDLAWEQETFAECTTIPAGVSTLHHARALVGREQWFLHERP